MSDTNPSDSYGDGSERYQPCQECSEPVDTLESGHWKAPNDEQWWHEECYDKLEKVEEIREEILGLIIPETDYDGYSDEFHCRLDNAQDELARAVERERLKQDQDIVTDGGTDGKARYRIEHRRDIQYCPGCGEETEHQVQDREYHVSCPDCGEVSIA